MMLLAPLVWRGQDLQDEDEGDDAVSQHWITAFGRAQDGRSVCMRLPWCPRFFVHTPRLASLSEQQRFLELFRHRRRELSQGVQRTSIYGFCAGRKSTFVRLAFGTARDATNARYQAERLGYKTFQAAVETTAQFMHAGGIRPCGWVQAQGYSVVVGEARVSRCDLEILLPSHTYATPAADPPAQPVPWALASWDLETYSGDGRFPDPDAEDCPIIQVGVVLARFQVPGTRRVVITTLPCHDVQGVEIIRADGEAAALRAFADLLAQHQVDILMAWNGYGFDNRYLLVRASRHDIEPLVNLGKLREETLAAVAVRIKGVQHMLLRATGVLQFDPMHFLRGEDRFEKYSLNHVAGSVLGQQKLDLPAHRIFELHRGGTSEGQATIADYCAVDCDLTLQVTHKLALVPNIVALANATRTPVEHVLTRGQVRLRPLPQLRPVPVLACLLQDVLRHVGRRPGEGVVLPAGLQRVPQLRGVVREEPEHVLHHRRHRVLPHLLARLLARAQHEGRHRVPHRRHHRRRQEVGVAPAGRPRLHLCSPPGRPSNVPSDAAGHPRLQPAAVQGQGARLPAAGRQERPRRQGGQVRGGHRPGRRQGGAPAAGRRPRLRLAGGSLPAAALVDPVLAAAA